MSIYPIYKKIAFSFDPEKVHNSTMRVLSNFPTLAKLHKIDTDQSMHISSQHLNWKFPIGLGAGLDKNAEALEYFNQLGFGAIEAGTVTPKKQDGNPRPRIWRLEKSESLRNAMGFPNKGMEYFANNINGNKVHCLGINIGKNKDSKNEIDDYITLAKKFNENFLKNLSEELKKENISTPVFVKISPDMNDQETTKITEKCIENDFQGIICSNTTSKHSYSSGGVSGKDLKELSAYKRKLVCNITKSVSYFDTIGVGGVSSVDDLFKFWKDGGDMMQIYTSFIYQGPEILLHFQNELKKNLLKYDLKSINELKSFFRHHK